MKKPTKTNSNKKPALAITGATGFIGEHLLHMALNMGHNVHALTRGKKIAVDATWINGSLDRPESLATLCAGADAVVHVAGLINGSKDAFDSINVAGTAAMIEAARASGVRRFIHISSLAAREAELSHYGASKARAEELVTASGLDWTIIRPPAVYGPGDPETLELFKMAKRGFIVLPPKGRFSLIHVEDLCRLILSLAEYPDSFSQIYEPDDAQENGWEHHHFAQILGYVFDRRAVSLSIPKAVLKVISKVDVSLRRDKAKLTTDRVNYICHPDWVVAKKRRPPHGLWQPQIHTPTGLKQTALWYFAQKWL